MSPANLGLFTAKANRGLFAVHDTSSNLFTQVQLQSIVFLEEKHVAPSFILTARCNTAIIMLRLQCLSYALVSFIQHCNDPVVRPFMNRMVERIQSNKSGPYHDESAL